MRGLSLHLFESIAMIVVVMGVSGSGKTTVGKLLAESLQWNFRDADDFHPPENVEKMSRGIPLEDSDRLPWLLTLQSAIDEWLREGKNTVLACSALKDSYRQMLQRDRDRVKLVYLKGSFDLISQRLNQRQQHYMKVDLLKSQFDALEEPQESILIDISQPPEAIAQLIKTSLRI